MWITTSPTPASLKYPTISVHNVKHTVIFDKLIIGRRFQKDMKTPYLFQFPY